MNGPRRLGPVSVLFQLIELHATWRCAIGHDAHAHCESHNVVLYSAWASNLGQPCMLMVELKLVFGRGPGSGILRSKTRRKHYTGITLGVVTPSWRSENGE